MAKVTYSEIAEDLKQTSALSYETKGTYAYATGMYESIIAGLVAELPERKQREVLRTLQYGRDSMLK
jgi:hypothetical protein